MGKKASGTDTRLYLGVDVGGTKIQASLIEECGSIIARHKCPSPRKGGAKAIVKTIEEAIGQVLAEQEREARSLAAMGIAIPGVVDPQTGRVVVTPNMELSGAPIVSQLEKKFAVPVALGNDCNLGTLGEHWLGAGRDAGSVVGIFVGTGIGAGFARQGQIWQGAREAAMEIGHMIMEIGGPVCGCGGRGCLEAIASRSAIERDIRAAVKRGKKTALTDLLDGKLAIIKSSALREALKSKDKLVTDVMRRASEILGYACINIRHLLDPEVIVLGGGVIEACSRFMLPIMQKIVDADQLPGARDGGHVQLSRLGDDAVVLGAVALARQQVGRSPFDGECAMPEYPEVTADAFGRIGVGEETYEGDVYIRVNGKVKKRKKSLAKKEYGSSHRLGPQELEKVCRGGPQVLFVGAGHSEQLELTEEGAEFLRRRAIEVRRSATPQAAREFNASTQRRAGLFHVTC